MRKVVFRNYQKSRGILVYSVNNARANHSIYAGKAVAAVIQKRIDKCTFPVSIRRVNNHSLRFVDNEQIVILIHNVERNILCLCLKRHGIGYGYTDFVTEPAYIIFVFRFSVDGNIASVNESLSCGTRNAVCQIDYYFIKALCSITFVNS